MAKRYVNLKLFVGTNLYPFNKTTGPLKTTSVDQKIENIVAILPQYLVKKRSLQHVTKSIKLRTVSQGFKLAVDSVFREYIHPRFNQTNTPSIYFLHTSVNSYQQKCLHPPC